LIGPVYAAAVVLNKSINRRLLKDSKILSNPKEKFCQNIFKKKFYLGNRKSLPRRRLRRLIF
jgi:ribonuclease HII